jgi:lipopolysaccharide transport system ATP-binding protein
VGDTRPIIGVEGLGKKYQIRHQEAGKARYSSLRDTIMSGLRSAGRRVLRPSDRKQSPTREEFWALRDLSIAVNPGEVVGIIGRNGAGKSTLLKILSRITEPTTGQVTLRGRVASLLEVGTGFHPELTGRENVFLNGTILGMSRAEIRRKFDEIVAFAEVEKFLDTPVKRYSSGMYMRLAFAVAAHLEPEILVVDEVLAVGDASFQEKCLGKMGEVAKAGRTVLFVSHNIGAIKTLTRRCLFLMGGRLALDGSPDAAISEYLGKGTITSGTQFDLSHYRRSTNASDQDVLFRDVYVSTEEMSRVGNIKADQSITINAVIESKRPVGGACINIVLYNARQERILHLFSYDHGRRFSLQRGIQTITCKLPPLQLAFGDYYIDVGIAQAAYVLSWDVLLKVPLFNVPDDLGDLEWHDRPWGCFHLRNVEWDVAELSQDKS